jgi:hypothetical protein
MTEKQECPTCKRRKLQDDVKFYEKIIKDMIDSCVFMDANDSEFIHKCQNKIGDLNKKIHEMGR